MGIITFSASDLMNKAWNVQIASNYQKRDRCRSML